MERSEVARIIESTPRIMVVDDDESFRKTISAIIRRQNNYEVTLLGNAEAAIEEVKKNFCHVAIIDFKLKGTEDGLHLAESLKKIDPYIGLILMTGYASLDLAIESMKKGIDVFLAKPAEPVDVILSVSQVLTKQRLVFEREKLIKELRDANNKLQDIDKLKTRFVSMVSHELKTPLTAILGYSGHIIKDNIIGDIKSVRFAVKSIISEGKHLSRLIDDLLDMTRIETKKFKVYKQKSSIPDILRMSLEEVDLKFKENNISLTEKFDPNLPEIIVDPDRITQVITILLNNASEHTKAGGRVELKVCRRNKELYIEVKDTGEGIEEDNVSHLFEYFYQAEGSDRGRKSQGLGLGLVIAKEIIDWHNGIIKAESEGRSKGSKFYFTIPFGDKDG